MPPTARCTLCGKATECNNQKNLFAEIEHAVHNYVFVYNQYRFMEKATWVDPLI